MNNRIINVVDCIVDSLCTPHIRLKKEDSKKGKRIVIQVEGYGILRTYDKGNTWVGKIYNMKFKLTYSELLLFLSDYFKIHLNLRNMDIVITSDNLDIFRRGVL